jgi:hypothetical protein
MNSARVLVGLVGLMAAVALAEKPAYTMADLKALEKSGGWAELLEHLNDVTPAARDAAWEALAEKAAVARLGDVPKARDRLSASTESVELLKRFPFLKASKPFAAKRLELGPKELKACYDEELYERPCPKLFLDVLDAAKDGELAFQAGKVARAKQNSYDAMPFFQRAFALEAGAKWCADEDLKLAVMAGLGLPADDARAKAAVEVATAKCASAFQSTIADAFASEGESFQKNTCPFLLKAKAIQGLQAKKCERLK